MKKQFAALMLIAGVIFGFNVNAQDATAQKIGHINADQLLQSMPETKDAQAQLETYGAQLEKDLTEMEAELESKMRKFQENVEMMTKLSRETKSQEIQELQGRIQEYSRKAQQDLQNKQVELLSPIIEKATNAVQRVAKANNFTYIMDSSQSKAVLIYTEGGIDIMPMVKKELGIQ